MRACTAKSCIKAAACVQFFNFLVRLLFKDGFYLRVTYVQSPESAKPEKTVGHMWNDSETWRGDCSTFISNVNKHLACEKRYNFDLVLHRRQLATFFELRLLFECGLCATCVLRKCGFYLSAASNLVRLLYMTLRYLSRLTLTQFF